MKLSEIRNQGDSDLIGREKVLKKEIFEMRQQRLMGKLEKPAKFKTIRREVARVLTVLKERKK